MTDENLPTISETQPTASEPLARNLSHAFINNHAEQADDQVPEASQTEESRGCGPVTICPVPATGSALEKETNLKSPGFRIQDSCLPFEDEPRQSTPLHPTADVSMVCALNGSTVNACQLSISERVTDGSTKVVFGNDDSSLESQQAPGQETPLPLSVMPHVRPITPGGYAVSTEKVVKLFVDLETETSSTPDESLRDYYELCGAPLTTQSEQDEVDGISASMKTNKESETTGGSELHMGKDEADEDDRVVENLLLQASTVSVDSTKAVASTLKSCLLTPSRKVPSTMNVSFLCSPVVSSPLAGRSDIVKEWTDDQKQEESSEQIREILCSFEEQPGNNRLILKALDEVVLLLWPHSPLLSYLRSQFDTGITFATLLLTLTSLIPMQNSLVFEPSEANPRSVPTFKSTALDSSSDDEWTYVLFLMRLMFVRISMMTC
jgi:hypothetical protein